MTKLMKNNTSGAARLQIGLSPTIFGTFSGYRAKLFTRVILGPAQRNYIEKGTLPPKSAPQNKIGLKFLLQKVEIFRRQPSPVSIGLSPICSPVRQTAVQMLHLRPTRRTVPIFDMKCVLNFSEGHSGEQPPRSTRWMLQVVK